MFFPKGTPSGEDTGAGLRRAGTGRGITRLHKRSAEAGETRSPGSGATNPSQNWGQSPLFASIGQSNAEPAPSR